MDDSITVDDKHMDDNMDENMDDKLSTPQKTRKNKYVS